MTRIDPIRLSEIFRTLTSKSKTNPAKTQASHKTLNKEGLSNERDANVLKAHLTQRLNTLKEKSDTFAEEAPYVTIQEIMCWEFGDQFLNHPDFKHITHSIVTAIEGSPETNKHMRTLIESLTGE